MQSICVGFITGILSLVQIQMNESLQIQNFISLNDSKSLSIHEAALNSIFIFSELKEDQANEKSTIQKNIEEIQTLIAQLQHQQTQCVLLNKEIEMKKQNYYKFKAEIELFIIMEEENEKKESYQQEKQFEQLNKRTTTLINKTRQILKAKDIGWDEKRMPLRKVF